jgi:hypothetical protein
MQDHERNKQLYRETADAVHSQEGVNSDSVVKHGVIISAAATGNRVTIDMFATTITSVKAIEALQPENEAA